MWRLPFFTVSIYALLVLKLGIGEVLDVFTKSFYNLGWTFCMLHLLAKKTRWEIIDLFLFIIPVLVFRIFLFLYCCNCWLVAGTFLKAAESALKLEERRSRIYKEVVAETGALRRNVVIHQNECCQHLKLITEMLFFACMSDVAYSVNLLFCFPLSSV